jgi:hypothetical protein
VTVKRVALWAFIAGFLNGLLLWVRDYIYEKESEDADKSKPP